MTKKRHYGGGSFYRTPAVSALLAPEYCDGAHGQAASGQTHEQPEATHVEGCCGLLMPLQDYLALEPTVAWSALGTCYGPLLLHDARYVIDTNCSESNFASTDRAARILLGWMVHVDRGETVAAVASRFASSLGAISPEADLHRLSAAFGAWETWLAESSEWKSTTVYKHARGAATVLEWLGTMPSGRYPAFRVSFSNTSRGIGNGPALGSLDFPGLERLVGIAREKRALECVRAAALEEFEREEMLFGFGLTLLSSGRSPAGTSDAACAAVLNVLNEVSAKLRSRRLGQTISLRQLVAGVDPSVLLTATWVAAGLPAAIVDKVSGGAERLTALTFYTLVLACLSSTAVSTLAVAVILACDLGWNRQPIFDLPQKYIVFRVKGKAAVADLAFIAALKNRCSHFVLACLQSGEELPELLCDRAVADWDAAASLVEDGHAFLEPSGGGGTLDILERYERLASAARNLDVFCKASTRLLTFPRLGAASAAQASLTVANPSLRLHAPSLYKLGHLSFPAIRKSFLQVRHGLNGSASTTAVTAGHTGTATLMKSYITNAELMTELKQTIRLFQNAIESLILSPAWNAPRELAHIAPTELVWFRRMADQSGISAALGIVPTRAGAPAPAFRFDPTDANMRDLFLAHWALRKAALHMPVRQWRAQCLPLLAYTKAIGFAISGKGLRRAYLTAARDAHRSLRTGKVSLPALEGMP